MHAVSRPSSAWGTVASDQDVRHAVSITHVVHEHHGSVRDGIHRHQRSASTLSEELTYGQKYISDSPAQ